jgi:ABC-2 type transport system ATP-binding protein
MIMIEAKNLEKRYGDRAVVRGVSLKVDAGEVYALLGGNGAGKTTTMHMLLGLIDSDGGEAWIDGKRVEKSKRPKAAFVPEVVDLYPDLDPRETLELFAGVAGLDVQKDRIKTALLDSGLDEAHHGRRLRVLSKGMRQKVALAAAELQGARAIFLDEPTSGLDPSAADVLIARLAQMKKSGAAILMSTHDVLQAEAIADRIGIMQNGQLIVEKKKNELGEPLMDLYRRVSS